MSDVVGYVAGGGLLVSVASAAWRIYYLRLCRRVFDETKDPTVLEYAKAVFGQSKAITETRNQSSTAQSLRLPTARHSE